MHEGCLCTVKFQECTRLALRLGPTRGLNFLFFFFFVLKSKWKLSNACLNLHGKKTRLSLGPNLGLSQVQNILRLCGLHLNGFHFGFDEA